MAMRLLLALAVLANPAAFPCQYFVVEMEVEECAARAAEICCCSCEPAPQASCSPSGCEVNVEQPSGTDREDDRCRCCIRMSADPRVPSKLKARPVKSRLAPAPEFQAAGPLNYASFAALQRNHLDERSTRAAEISRTLRPLLCVWLK